MFEQRKRRKEAARRLDEAIAAEWASHGVVQTRPGQDLGEAAAAAGLGSPGDPAYTELVLKVMDDAVNRLSPEDRFLVTKGREGTDPSAKS